MLLRPFDSPISRTVAQKRNTREDKRKKLLDLFALSLIDL